MKQNVRPIQLLDDELRAIYREYHKEKEPDEFTIPEFAAANGIPLKDAENFVCHGVTSGIFTKRMGIFVGGRLRTVYKKA